MSNLHEMAQAARTAFYPVSVSDIETRNRALIEMAGQLASRKEFLFEENRADLCAAEADHLAAPLLHRLRFGEEKLNQVIAGLHALAALEDPLGKTTGPVSCQGTNSSSSRFARPAKAMPSTPNSSNIVRAAVSCGLPPSRMTRSGRDPKRPSAMRSLL